MTKKIFRVIAFLEGVSYLLLLIAVPIKYFMNNEYYVKLLGMPHGILFICYIILGVYFSFKEEWKTKTILFILGASVIPFGTFYIDRKYLKI